MSEHTTTMNTEPDSAGMIAARRRRWTFYAVSAGAALLALAYIDGGEEPIHPIVQYVALPDSNGASQ